MNRKKLSTAGLTLLLVLALALTTVSAANVHLKGGKNAEPSFYDGGLTLNAMGELAGLGYEDVLVILDATADVTATCTNNGGNQAPGQNPAPINVTGSQAIPKAELKNGNTPFDVTTDAPPAEIPGAPDCPNPNWTEEIIDLAFTSAIITVEEPAGNVVLTVSCTFDEPTMDGAVSKAMVSCTSQ